MSAQSPQHDGPKRDSRWMLDHALALTRMMVSAAMAGDWELVTKLEEQRRDVLHGGLVAEHVAEVLELNRQLLEIVTRAKDEYERQLGGLARGKHAKAAYQGLDY